MDSKVCWERNDQGRGDKPKSTTVPGENENGVWVPGIPKEVVGASLLSMAVNHIHQRKKGEDPSLYRITSTRAPGEKGLHCFGSLLQVRPTAVPGMLWVLKNEWLQGSKTQVAKVALHSSHSSI